MSTIYTLNSKVLKNTANDKWLIKKPVLPADEVQIGNQIWKNKNLAIDDGQGGILTRSISYDGDQTFVTEYYYNLLAAQRIANSISGWHLPTLSEIETLISTIGGTTGGATKLKATYSWGERYNGTDDYGFTALKTGNNYRNNLWQSISFSIWTATLDPNNSSKAYMLQLTTGADITTIKSIDISNYYISVRLIKD